MSSQQPWPSRLPPRRMEPTRRYVEHRYCTVRQYVNTSVPSHAPSVSQSVSSLAEGQTEGPFACLPTVESRVVGTRVGLSLCPAAPSPTCQMPSTARQLEKVFFLKSLSGFAGSSAYAVLDQELESILPRSPPDPHPSYHRGAQRLAKAATDLEHGLIALESVALGLFVHSDTKQCPRKRSSPNSGWERLRETGLAPRSRHPGLRRIYCRVIAQ